MSPSQFDPSEPASLEPAPAPMRPRRRRFGVIALLALALASGALAGSMAGVVAGAAWLAPQPAAAAGATALPVAQGAAVPNIAGPIFNAVGPAVVEVVVAGSESRNGFTPVSGGSGFVVDASGLILTNYHVVARSSSVRVRFSTGETRTAQVLGTDRGNDLALLQVDLPANTPAAPLGDSDRVAVGEPAIAIGSPFGLEATVTQGIISAVHRNWQPQGSTAQLNLIQTDAPINPGNSGGPLLNANGEVIGVTTAIESPVRGSVGVGFAVPINTVKQILPQLRSGARLEPVWLGISGQALDATIAQAQSLPVQRGVLVSSVVSNGPAARAGVQEGDVITRIDGAAIASVTDLAQQLVNHRPGDKVTVAIIRGGQERAISVTLQARPAETQ